MKYLPCKKCGLDIRCEDEDTEVVHASHGECSKGLQAEVKRLKALVYTPKGFEWKDCLEQAKAEIAELREEVERLKDDIENRKTVARIRSKALKQTEAQNKVLRKEVEMLKREIQGIYEDQAGADI